MKADSDASRIRCLNERHRDLTHSINRLVCCRMLEDESKISCFLRICSDETSRKNLMIPFNQKYRKAYNLLRKIFIWHNES